MFPEDNTPLELLKPVPAEKFLADFDLPKIPYSKETVLPIRYAGVFMEDIIKDGINVGNQYLYDEAFEPFVYILYQAEIGLKNRIRFEKEEGHIFAPQGTEAYNFLANKKAFVNPPEFRIEEIQALRNTFLRLLSDKRRKESGFGQLNVRDISDGELQKTLEFLIRLFGKDNRGSIDWDHTPVFETISDKVLY